MTHNIILKSLTALIIGIIFIFIIISIFLSYTFYNNIFRLSSDDVLMSLKTTSTQCKKISTCNLLPGDILIRRYMTPRTELFDKLANPFFTHSAFYFGDSKIVEAIGTEKNPQDDIQITTLSKSDWLNSDIDNFIIIRPKNYSQKLAIIKNNLENIAEDPDYTFGLPKQGHKKTTCADIIFQQLLTEKVVQISNPPKIITPDYLFWLTNDNPNKFKIIGYNFQE